MVDKPIEKMKRDELIALVKECIEKLQEGSEHADVINKFYDGNWSRVQDVENEITDIKTRVDDWGKQIEGNANTASEKLEEINTLQQTASETKSNVDECYNSIEKCHSDLFGYEDEESGEQVPGKQKEFNDFYEEKQKNYEKLANDIDGLLPGAVAAGLASGFKKARDETTGIAFLVMGFIASLGLLIFVNSGLKFNIDLPFIKFVTPAAGSAWESLLYRVTLSFPLGWIAWYCQKSIFEAKRIKEEYHHKQRVMELYVGLSKQTEGFSNEDASIKLFQTVLDAVGKNPAVQVKNTSLQKEILSTLRKVLKAVKTTKVKP